MQKRPDQQGPDGSFSVGMRPNLFVRTAPSLYQIDVTSQQVAGEELARPSSTLSGRKQRGCRGLADFFNVDLEAKAISGLIQQLEVIQQRG